MKKRKYEDDDGRRIADMSTVETPNDPLLGGGSFRKKERLGQREADPQAPGSPPLDKKETRRIVFYALRAGLLIGLIFIGAALIFLLFCRYVWFR
jgi:hypothetical protein